MKPLSNGILGTEDGGFQELWADELVLSFNSTGLQLYKKKLVLERGVGDGSQQYNVINDTHLYTLKWWKRYDLFS